MKVDLVHKCFVCDGQGKQHLWKDRDPIEGYKLAPLYPCFFCNGEGEIYEGDERWPAVVAYQKTIEKIRANNKKKKETIQQKQEKALASALKKLSRDELNAVRNAEQIQLNKIPYAKDADTRYK